MKVGKKEIFQNGKTINFTHIELGSNSVCFMFSGGSYNYDKPLFYYSTMVMIQNNIDIVHIHYSYNEHTIKNSIEEITKIMMEDINPVISIVLQNGKYDETIFLGKSLGTIPIANNLMRRKEFLKSKMILLTPLLKFDTIFESILKQPHQGLLIIGDKDPHYNINKVDQLRSKGNLKIEIVKNSNHSLDIGEFETSKSIMGLSEVMEKIERTFK